MKLKQIGLLSLASLILATTAGCTMNPDRIKQQNVRDNGQLLYHGRQDRDQDNRPIGANNRNTNTMDDRVELADRAAENITKLNNVRSANVLITRRNAYVAAVLDQNGGTMSKAVEDQIAEQVRKTNADIQNVYVSTNPQFVDRVNTYVDDVQAGRPVTGFFEQFNEMIARIFPDAK